MYVLGVINMTDIKNKILENKEEKERKLLDAGYTLFTEKGFKNTSIQEIVDKAGVAKGTFYLYFKDKYDIENRLIIDTSKELFEDAIRHVNDKNLDNFEDRLIAIVDYIIDYLKDNSDVLKIVSKSLSLGVFSDKISNIIDDKPIGILDTFMKGIGESNLKLKNPEITLFMIIELTSSVVFSSITMNVPLPIDEIKPYLYEDIRKILKD